MTVKDMIVVVAVVLAFAVMITAHMAIVYGLAFRAPRWRAPVAFAFAPAGIYWALKEHMRVRAWLLVGSVVVYALARVLAL